MPPQCNRQTPPIILSWLTARRRRATFRQDAGEYKRQCLKAFHCHLRIHNIPYFKLSHRVFVLGPHSWRYFLTTLQSLLELDYIPRKVKVPTAWLPHHCQFCWETNGIQPPFNANAEDPAGMSLHRKTSRKTARMRKVQRLWIGHNPIPPYPT
jgi:hypothetical protein